MSTIYSPARPADRSAPQAPAATRYTGAAELCAAIRAAAALAPDIRPDIEHADRYVPSRYPHAVPQEYETGAEFWSGPVSFTVVNGQRIGRDERERTACAGPACHWPRVDIKPETPGPFLPVPCDARATFAYRVDGQACGSLTVANTRAALLALADKVNAQRAAFDGKPRRTRLPSRPRAGSAPHVAARGLWADGDLRGALTLARSVGSIFFGAGKDAPIPYMNAEHVRAADHDWIIGRGVMKGAGFYVLHLEKALSVGDSFTSHSAALDYLETMANEEPWRAKLAAKLPTLPNYSQTAALAHYMGADDEIGAESAAAAPEDTAAAPIAPAPMSAPETAADAPTGPESDAEIIGGARLDPIQYLPTFARVAIDRIDADSSLRNGAAVRELCAAYAKTYGLTCDRDTLGSVLHICARRFPGYRPTVAREVSAAMAPAPISAADASEARDIVESFFDAHLSGAPGCTVPVEKMEARAAWLRGSAAGFAHAPARGIPYAEAARILESHAAAKRAAPPPAYAIPDAPAPGPFAPMSTADLRRFIDGCHRDRAYGIDFEHATRELNDRTGGPGGPGYAIPTASAPAGAIPAGGVLATQSHAETVDAAPPAAPPVPTQSAHRYALQNRPAGIGAVPRVAFEIEPRPAPGAAHHDKARHGIFVSARELTADECRSFELAPLIDGAALGALAQTIAGQLSDYAAEYVAQSIEEPEEFAAAILQRTETRRVSVGDPAALVSGVVDALRALAAPVAETAPIAPPAGDRAAPAAPDWFAEIQASAAARRERAASLAAGAEFPEIGGGSVRFTHADGERYGIAGPCMSTAGRFRFTHFDARGPVGDLGFTSLAAAIEEALDMSYAPVPAGAADPAGLAPVAPLTSDSAPLTGQSEAPARPCIVYHFNSEPVFVTRDRAAYLLRAARSRGGWNRPRCTDAHCYAFTAIRMRLETGRAAPITGDSAARTVPAAPYASDTHERPCAAPGLTSYRARGVWGWIMIGATDHADAMREARRSTAEPRDLQVWDGARYVPAVDPLPGDSQAAPLAGESGAAARKREASAPLRALRHHVSGAIARGEGVAIVEVRAAPIAPAAELDDDETIPAPLDGLDVSETDDPEALAMFEPAPPIEPARRLAERAAEDAAFDAEAAAMPAAEFAHWNPHLTPAHRADLQERARLAAARPGPSSLRIPGGDLRSFIPARFAPVYVLRGAL